MSTNDNQTKVKSHADKIASWSLIISILALIISASAFLLDKNNHPLIVEFKGYQLATITTNNNNLHTPTASDSLPDNPPFITDSNVIDLLFKKKQGNVSKVYLVEYNDKKDIIYTQLKSNKSLNEIVVEVPLTKKETIVEDLDFPDKKITYNVPCMQSFVLAFFDYNNDISIYYTVLRPRPINEIDNFSIFPLSVDGENRAVIFDIKNWKYDVASIECSKTNVESIRKSILNIFNSSYNIICQFQYDENKNEYLSSFVLFQDKNGKTISHAPVVDNPKIIVIHDNLDIERDYELINTVANDK